ncbi:hypothetical protein [Campylobacter helveticus]|nr:hypothetical protein [Campylobacter helveticus]MCR2039380.1 hypothetical protein [Campylobacter helveticus]MCR2056788.1 hypothetical protein [Campylobacter helveticus]MCR2060485.1 hypothetical protein [Campylobacter helveticus]MCR2067315.1 hypothetical protein [Campylobacter helveticus]SMC22513.1 hypothetical protein SAMN02745125_01434 [Campylobacter helveticus]
MLKFLENVALGVFINSLYAFGMDNNSLDNYVVMLLSLGTLLFVSLIKEK